MKGKTSKNLNSFAKKALRLFGVILFALIILSVLRGISKVVSSENRVRDARLKLLEAKKEQEELKEKLSEMSSSFYTEKLARDKLGFAREGEKVIVLPEEALLRRLSPRRTDIEKMETSEPNWRKWIKLFFEI